MYAEGGGPTGVGPLFAHRCRSHGPTISGQLLEGCSFYKGFSLFLTPIVTTFPLLSGREIWIALTPDVRGGYHLQASPMAPPHPAWISRQNVSLAVVLERSALNFKFSNTFPLNGTARQRRGERERKRKKAWETVPVEG